MPARAERSPRRRAGRAILAAVVVLAVMPAYLALSPPWQPVAVHLACAAIVIAGCVRVLRLARSATEAQPLSPLDAPPPPAALPALDARFLALRDAVADRCQEVLGALGQVIVGKTSVLQQVLAGILANGHILIEDYPGLAKTVIARLVAQTLDLGFKRIQFTPDLLPSDITGSFLYDQREARFEFRPGPVFTNLLLADEINRATPKTQAALLEAMQEAQVTIEGQSFPLEQPFVVIATQNPIEMEGTYPLPEAQLDRFLMRLRVGYPDRDDEVEILARRRRRRKDAVSIASVISRAELGAMQGCLEEVHVA